MPEQEVNFDGLVGPTHNYAGLSAGNIASTRHGGNISNPRAAALQGLAKMHFVASLGVPQAVLPPQPRPDVDTLRRLGFGGSDADVLAQASSGDALLLRLTSSASSMWTANAATVAPSRDTRDGRLHLVPANLCAMFHRSLEAAQTTRILRAVFADSTRFEVHDPLPSGEYFSDEGAANAIRLTTDGASIHLLAWGRSAAAKDGPPQRFPRRQTLEASQAVSRLCTLPDAAVRFVRQSGRGIDAGAFHTDVLAVGNGSFLMLHEHAFEEPEALLAELERTLGGAFGHCLATEAELPAADAVNAYPFNSQLVTLPNGRMALIAPAESERSTTVQRFLKRLQAEANPVDAVHYVDVNASMNNGGGPACLRLRVSMTEEERNAVRARVFLDAALHADLVRWVERHYRDRLSGGDLADPALLDESRRALDELTAMLSLGSIYDFQRS